MTLRRQLTTLTPEPTKGKAWLYAIVLSGYPAVTLSSGAKSSASQTPFYGRLPALSVRALSVRAQWELILP